MLQNHALVKEHFKVQNRQMDITTNYNIITDIISDFIFATSILKYYLSSYSVVAKKNITGI